MEGDGGNGGNGGGGQGLNKIQTAFTVVGTVFGALALGVAIYECRKGGRLRRHQTSGYGAAAITTGSHNTFNMARLQSNTP